MQRSTPILAVLLLASLLGNVLLAVRLSRVPDPAALPPKPPPSAERAGASPSSQTLESALEAERKKTQELQARVERLETDKKVLAQDSPGAPGAADKLAAFRIKLRKLKKIMSDPALKNGNNVDPDDMVALTETMMEFMRMSALRSKEPKAYAQYLQAFYEIGVEGEGSSLTAEQTAALSALLQGYGEELSRVPAAPAGERLLKELQLEASTTSRVQALLTDVQREALAKGQMEVLGSVNGLSSAFVMKEGAAAQIAQQWSSLYQLDASQLPQAKVAAQAYVDAMSRLPADPSFTKPGSPEAYDYRLKAVKEQLSALTLLQASMTPAQAERLRTQTMKEIHIVDGAAQVETGTAPEK